MRGERLMDLAAATRWLAEELGVTRDRNSVYRWIYYGVSGVKLEAVSVAGQWHTSAQALRRFLAACTRRHSADSGANVNELAL